MFTRIGSYRAINERTITLSLVAVLTIAIVLLPSVSPASWEPASPTPSGSGDRDLPLYDGTESQVASVPATELRNTGLKVLGKKCKNRKCRKKGRSVRLSGRAIFRSLPEVIGTDPAGDALIAGAGADLVAASVSGPSPDSKDIEFMLEVADPLPAPLNGAPEGITYTVMFDNWGSPGILYRLEIAMTSQYHEPGSVDPVGVLVECPTSAPPTCHETCCMAAGAPYGVPQLWGPGRVIPIPTDIDGGVIRARVPIDELTLPTGRIRFYTRDGTLPLQEPKKLPPVTTQVAIPSGSLAMELNTSGANRVDALEINPESGRTCPLTDGRPCRFYSVPKKSIRAGVARAPISASKVPLKATWKAKSNGSFEGTFRKLRIGKRYRFVVEACYGWGNCSRWTRVIKVPR